MPLFTVTLTPGAFDGPATARLARALTEAAFEAESIPDEPGPRARGIVLVQELAPGQCYSAGEPADALLRGVFATLQVSAGVLDAARKARLAAAVQAAAEAAAPDRSRPVVTSLEIREVPEGQWAQNGRIARLPEMAATARFGHLVEALARPR
jgi:phenylpyruvate tautomerase PptA (4-oxalocrotonate tautomerase family)